MSITNETNRAIVILISICVCLLCLVYIGSKDQLDELKADLLVNFIARFFAAWLVGIFFFAILLLFNLILAKLKVIELSWQQISKLGRFAMMAIAIGSIIGNCIFFFH